MTLEAKATGRVLFLCTGNFFRSAFAEHYFNHLASENQKLSPEDPLRKVVRWTAASRGLDVAQLTPLQRAQNMSPFTQERLKAMAIPWPLAPGTGLPAHTPTPLTLADLERFAPIIALHGPSHRPMLLALLEDRNGALASGGLMEAITFWDIEDILPDFPPASQAARRRRVRTTLDQVQRATQSLFQNL